MDRIASYFICFLLSAFPACAPAAIDVGNPVHTKVHSLHVDGEVNRDRIYSMARDARGYIWMGSDNGLKRYDGYEIKTYTSDSNDPQSMGSNNASIVLIDSNDTLWIGGTMLSEYNPEQDAFDNYPETDVGGILTIAETPGMLWLGGESFGLLGFDLETRRVAYHRPLPYETGQRWKIEDIARDIDDPRILWLASHSGVFRFDTRDHALDRIFTSEKLGGPQTQLVRSMIMDDTGRLWLASNKGLFVIDPATGAARHYQRRSDRPFSLATNVLSSVFEDSAGRIWIGTDKMGVHVYRPATDDFIHLPASTSGSFTFGPANISHIYEDANGSLWFSAELFGIQRISPQLEKFYTIGSGEGDKKLSFDSLLDLHEDRHGHIWIATDGGGLNRYDPETGTIKKYYHDPDDPRSLSSNSVLALEEDADGTLWIGTWTGGLNRFNPETDDFDRFNHDPTAPADRTIANDNVFYITADQEGWLWLSIWEKGLQRFHPESGKFITFDYNASDDRSNLTNGSINVIQPARDGGLWVGGYEGLERYDPEQQRFESMPLEGEENAVFDIHENSNGILWVATTRGLRRYNPDTQTEKRYLPADGLADPYVTSILVDDSGKLWIGTRGGLSVFSPETETFENFDKQDGLAATQFNRFSHLKSRDGTMYLGGPKGLTIFDPENIPYNTHVPNIVLTDFELFQQSVKPRESPYLDKAIDQAEKVTLPYSQRDITFQFSALSFISPTQNRYRYRLVGLEEKWTEVDSSRRRARYNNLDPGDYQFQVTGSNNDGVWNEQGARINLTVIAPWWMTLWARALMILSGLGAVYSFIKWRLTINQRRERELSREIEERRTAEAKLLNIAYHDALTGLPNRLRLMERLNKLIQRSQTSDRKRFALMFLDGDRFKKVNDTHGHQLGDELLIAAADRLQQVLPEKYHGMRLGGDEFTVLVEEYTLKQEVIDVANTIIAEFNKPFRVDHNLMFFKVSVGVVFCNTQYSYPGHILRDADLAMYKAKERGKGTYQVFDSKMREQALEAMELEADLYTAFSQNQLYLMYQPIVDLETGKLNGFEALVRWNHPTKGPIPPDKFIPVAEESGLIVTLGAWVLRQACAQLAAWIEQFKLDNPPSISVNLSSLELSEQDFLAQLDETLAETGLDSRLLKLEITESTLMEHTEAINSLLDALRQRNIQLAIDDFGTGYSSLRYLDQLPVQVLKIDRTFVDGIGGIDEDAGGSVEIVRATISLAHSLKIMVIAEGIETAQQYRLLKAWGCDFGQGYHIARPLLPVDATRFMNKEPMPEVCVQVAANALLEETSHKPVGSRRRYRDR